MAFEALALVPLVIWLWLLMARGQFWRIRPHVAATRASSSAAHIVVVIPARNEAQVIGATVESLLRQRFAGSLQIIVVDDGSSDGTAECARSAARSCAMLDRVTVLPAAPLPRGWTGKLWALSQGLTVGAQYQPDYFLLTDADIVHAPDSVARLLFSAEAGNRDLVSHMVKLSTVTLSERLLIPAFVFFFFKLYPPAWVASLTHRTAAAAGGCVLLRPAALAAIGGLEAIRSQIIDDCALARAVKACGGRILLELAPQTRSARIYVSAAEIGAMISRTAFAQLRHSYLLLSATLLGLVLTYLLPWMLLFSRDVRVAAAGLGAWMLMSACYYPMVRFYRLSPLWALCLPASALFYLGAVLHSATRYARGQGGMWKGRAQDA
jgi:hopene-associated glycosyltransferase HpnB